MDYVLGRFSRRKSYCFNLNKSNQHLKLLKLLQLHRPGVTQRGHPRRALSCYWISALPKSRGLCPFLLKCFQNNEGAQFWIETPEVVLAYSSALFHKQLRELSPPSLSPFMFLLQICARLSTYCCCLLNWIRLLA